MTESTIKFGTDGWRGVIARDFNFENALRIARAAAAFVISDRGEFLKSRKIIVGYDRRFLSDAVAAAMAETLSAQGLETAICSGPFPSSAVSLLTMKYGLGVIVTASHNPYYYNGVKFKWRGGSAPAALIRRIESLIETQSPVTSHKSPAGGRKPPPPRTVCHEAEYLEYLRSRADIRRIAGARRFPVALDFMHGCAAGCLEKLFRPGAFRLLRAGRDPLFGLASPEPVEAGLGGLAAEVRAERAACGFAFDGDGDRFAVFDERGVYLNPSVVFGLICDYVINSRGAKGRLVTSVSMGRLGARVARKAGLPAEETRVGFMALAERLRSCGDVVAAGEESGGYTWKGNLPERDGLVTALLFMEMLSRTRLTLSGLARRLRSEHGPSHYLRKDFGLKAPVADKAAFARRLRRRLPAKPLSRAVTGVSELDGLKLVLEDGAWLLIRSSGTEPLLRIYAETSSPAGTAALAGLAEKAIRKEGLIS
ncbi:MAG: hypothetical protein KKH28_13135 [Elusimicrobia bacterium]|nr:hypothetical protein [Elusimicrobiota bacterium]